MITEASFGCIPREPYIAERKRRIVGCITEIDSSVAMTWFTLATSKTDLRGVILEPAEVRMDIVRKGQEGVSVAYRAFTKDLNGRMGFYWDQSLYTLNPGWYLGDVYVQDSYCFSVQFRIRTCEIDVVGCENEYVGGGCSYDYCSPLGLVGC